MATKATPKKAPNIEVPSDPDPIEVPSDTVLATAEDALDPAVEAYTTEQPPKAAAPAAPSKPGHVSGRGTIDSPMDYDEAMRLHAEGKLKRSTFTTRGWLAVAKPIPAQAKL